jgi:hypothetical protein
VYSSAAKPHSPSDFAQFERFVRREPGDFAPRRRHNRYVWRDLWLPRGAERDRFLAARRVKPYNE